MALFTTETVRSSQQTKRISYGDKKKLRYYERERAKLIERSKSTHLPVGKHQDILKELNRLNGRIAGIKGPDTTAYTNNSTHKGAIGGRSGDYLPRAGKGVIDPRTGEYYPRAGKHGYVNPRTGEYLPAIR